MHWLGRVTNGATVVFEIDEDVDGNKIPARIILTDILVAPSEATIRAIRLFSRESRISVVGETYNEIYEDTWTDFTVASADPTADRTAVTYIDEDAPGQREGTIWGSIEIQEAANNSAFMIDIFFTESQGT
jgi:hypothetical protein